MQMNTRGQTDTAFYSFNVIGPDEMLFYVYKYSDQSIASSHPGSHPNSAAQTRSGPGALPCEAGKRREEGGVRKPGKVLVYSTCGTVLS